MRLGLGTGSTFFYALERLAERIHQDGFDLVGVPTSETTTRQARELGVPLTTLDEVDRLDLVIDGADEVDHELNLIKGGGGALVREKIVAAASERMLVVVSDNKVVERLGDTFLLPVEILPFGRRQVEASLRRLGLEPELRQATDDQPLRTDNGNWILDCKMDQRRAPAELEIEINRIPGVLDNGLFIHMASEVFVSDAGGSIRILEAQ